MFISLITSELAKVAIKKINELDAQEAAIAITTLRRALAGGPAIGPIVGIFGAGLAVGAGVGMLLAPEKGKELRTRVSGYLQRQASTIKHRFANGKSSSSLSSAESMS